MDAKRGPAAGLRLHQDLLRAHLEAGFNLVHLAETAGESPAVVARTIADARKAVSESKRLLGLLDGLSLDEYRSEIALLEWELNDLEHNFLAKR